MILKIYDSKKIILFWNVIKLTDHMKTLEIKGGKWYLFLKNIYVIYHF